MERGLYIAASGMVAEMARQDLIANDLANASTAGYKSDTRGAGELRQPPAAEHADRRQPSARSARARGSSARSPTSRPRRSRRPARTSTSPSQGDGFFAVQTAQGVRYTRNGQFTAAANGRLTDQLGNPVLNQNGQPITIGADGKVTAGTVGVFAVNNAAQDRRQPLHRAPPAAAARARCAPARSRAPAPTRRAR